MKIKSKDGFTLIEIMIVVAIIGMLAAIAIPNFVHARETARMNTCIVSLGCIANAKQEWALEQHKQNSDTPAGSDLQPYLGQTAAGTLPKCPADPAQTFATSYNPQSVGANPLCLVFPATHVMPQ
jgi:prepilin-type N-terminal cleavage/methylation domain-containing protein